LDPYFLLEPKISISELSRRSRTANSDPYQTFKSKISIPELNRSIHWPEVHPALSTIWRRTHDLHRFEQFSGKERDTESGLDNFGARYNASSMGRFTATIRLECLSHDVSKEKIAQRR